MYIDPRTHNTIKNIVIPLVTKGGGIVLTFFLIPMTIKYVSVEKYGIWLTIMSIANWLIYMDIGLGNGLKNKLGEQIALRNFTKAKALVSTTYVALTIIAVIIFVFGQLANFNVDWSQTLKVSESYREELKLVFSVVLSFFCLQLILQILNPVLFANQDIRISSILSFVGTFISFFLIYLLTKQNEEGSLIDLCLTIGISPVIVLITASLIIYNTKYKFIKPELKSIDFKEIKSLMGLGFKFLLIQIGQVLFYNTDNIIIGRVLGMEQVTQYNIAFKYFSIITMTGAIIMNPIWPAFVEARIKNDFNWINKVIKKLQLTACVLVLISIVMVIYSDQFYFFWIGTRVNISPELNIVLAIYVCINIFRTIYCSYINSYSFIGLQVVLILFAGIVNIPLSIYLGKSWGLVGIIASSALLSFVSGCLEYTQYKMIRNNKMFGIWKR